MKIVNIRRFYTIDIIKLRTHLKPSREISFVNFALCFNLYFKVFLKISNNFLQKKRIFSK